METCRSDTFHGLETMKERVNYQKQTPSSVSRPFHGGSQLPPREAQGKRPAGSISSSRAKRGDRLLIAISGDLSVRYLSWSGDHERTRSDAVLGPPGRPRTKDTGTNEDLPSSTASGPPSPTGKAENQAVEGICNPLTHHFTFPSFGINPACLPGLFASSRVACLNLQ